MNAPAPVLRLRDIAHAYGRTHTFAGLSLEVPGGGICCLLGPSGCGKTTVLRCIGGFERLAAGSIEIDGEVVSSRSVHLPPERRRIGMVFQDYALFPHLSVERNVAFGITDPDGRRERALELLDAVGLGWAAGRYPHELSGGQQQRVALARALAPAPRLMLLDEPFSNLDAGLREQLAGEIRTILKGAGTTAVFVTHDQNEAFALADRIAVMNLGRIEQLDSAYNLYHRPGTRFVADFVGQGVLVGATVASPQRLNFGVGEVACPVPIHDAESGETMATGEAVDVLLRPDDVVHDDASPITAVVLAKAFRGAEILYTLRLASGTQVLALVPSHHDHPLHRPIGIRFELDHVVAFRATGPALQNRK